MHDNGLIQVESGKKHTGFRSFIGIPIQILIILSALPYPELGAPVVSYCGVASLSRHCYYDNHIVSTGFEYDIS